MLTDEALIAKIGKRLAGIYDAQERADGRPGGALSAYNAGVDFCIEFWNRMAVAAIELSRSAAPSGNDELVERLLIEANEFERSPEPIDQETGAKFREAADRILSMSSEIEDARTDCAFLLSVIDSCDEAGAPSCEMEPEDVANIARIRKALSLDGGIG
jgi:hypothetical protein